MPYVFVYQCTRCDFDLEITLSREFRREPDGALVDYHYPDPELYEWPPRKVAGLWSHLWCPTCRAVRSKVLVELEGEAEHPVQLFLAAEARGLTGAETGPCPECGTPLLAELDEPPCPRCEAGVLAAIGDYEP